MEMTPQNIIAKLRSLFHERRQDSDQNYKSNYWWKWTGNWQLAQIMNWDVTSLRKMCKEMEQKGLLHSKKMSNMLMWACEIDGYVQHQFQDYYYKVEGICSQESCRPLETGCNVEGESHICKCKFFTQTNIDTQAAMRYEKKKNTN